MTNPDQPTIGDLTARLEFRYENDPLDFLKTGKGYLVVDDKVANIPLPTGKKGDRGEDGRLAEGDVRYFNRRTDDAEAAAEASEASAARSKASEEAAKSFETEAKAAATRAEDAQAEVDLVVEDSAGAIREHVKDDADRADRAATKAAEHEAGAGRAAAEAAAEATKAAEHEAGAGRAAAEAAAEATKAEVDKLTAGAPEAFDTLKEISDELEKNETERAALATTIGKKADKTYVDEKIDRIDYDTSKDLGDLQRKVVKAQGSADRGLSEIEDLEIGGRNYFLPSQVGNLGLPEELSSEEGMVFGWASHDLATMKQEEELFGLTNGMLSTYADFVQSPAFPRDYAQAAMDRGSDLLISWEPWDWYGEPDSQPEFSPRRISAGEHDEWITSWLTEAQVYAERIPVHVRFAPEMNDTARPWAALKEARGYEPATAEEYVEMWQHIWRIKELVAPDVKLMWNPLNFGAGERPFEDYFPGSDYVDSVALNGFNWSNVQNPEGTWQSHDDVFGFGDDEQSPVNRLIALANGKPWGLAEVASAPADPADFEEGGQYYDAWGSWVFEWPENPPYEETPEDWITQEGWTEMLIRRAYDKGASFLALFHTVKETDWRLTDTAKGRGVIQEAVDSGAKIKLGSSLDKNPNGELVTGASHRSFSLPVTPGERYTVSRSETSNNRFVFAFTGEVPGAGVKFVVPIGASSDPNDRLVIAGVRVPEGASHMVLHLSSRGDEIPKIMLEKGNKPSDWRPAPEETSEQIGTEISRAVGGLPSFVKVSEMPADPEPNTFYFTVEE